MYLSLAKSTTNNELIALLSAELNTRDFCLIDQIKHIRSCINWNFSVGAVTQRDLSVAISFLLIPATCWPGFVISRQFRDPNWSEIGLYFK